MCRFALGDQGRQCFTRDGGSTLAGRFLRNLHDGLGRHSVFSAVGRGEVGNFLPPILGDVTDTWVTFTNLKSLMMLPRWLLQGFQIRCRPVPTSLALLAVLQRSGSGSEGGDSTTAHGS